MNRDIRKNAIDGAKWTLSEQVLSLILSFVIGIVVARLVSPSDYGMIAMLSIFMALGNAFVNSGIGTALVRHKENSNADYSTAFFINIIIACIVYFILFLISPFISDFYDTPQLSDVCRIYFLNIVISSLTIVQIAKLTHELKYELQSIIKIVSLLISGAVGILLAFYGFGVWALVWYGLTASIIQTFLFWKFSGWKPMFIFSKQSWNYLYTFGSKMLLTNVIDVIYDNIYSLVIGKFYNSSFAGYYNRSLHFSQLPQNIISQIAGKVIIPVLTPYQNDNKTLLVVYGKIFRITVFFVYPVLILMAVLAEPIILILLGEKWMPAVPYFRILSVGVVFLSLILINLNLFVVKGRSDIMLKTDIIKKGSGLIIVACMVPLGMIWICVGSIIYAMIAFIINCNQTKKILGYGLKEQIRLAIPAFSYSVIMGGVVSSFIQLFESSIIKIIMGCISGLVFYCIIALICKEEAILELRNIVIKRHN